jgi:hypothetical protein
MRERRDGGNQRRYDKQCYSHRRDSFSVARTWSGSRAVQPVSFAARTNDLESVNRASGDAR